MKKIILILNAVIFSCCLLFSPSYANDLELVIKSVECQETNKFLIKYGVINYKDFDRRSTTIVFMVVEDKKPLACKELKTVIPKNDDGSEIYETTIDIPCKEKTYNLESAIFRYGIKRYKIDNFLSGCPK